MKKKLASTTTNFDVLRRGPDAPKADCVSVGRRTVGPPIPTFKGTGLCDAVDLDRMAELLDRLDADDAAH